MRLLVNHMQGKIYVNIIRYKRELSFECELRVEVLNLSLDYRHECNCMSIKNTLLYFIHKLLEGQLKHWKIYDRYLM